MSDSLHMRPLIRVCPRLAFVAVASAGLLSAGCSRSLTITQSEYVNTAEHIESGRGADSQTGVPLELDIVCVQPRDLQNEVNDRLKPGSGITAKEWYARRPLPGDSAGSAEGHRRFRLPQSQIYLMTDDSQFYGQRIGPCLRGAKLDGPTPITKNGIEFPAPALHDEQAVIYVFVKFTGKGGEVLEVAPIMFHPPGAYTDALYIKIGVDNSRPHFGQYAEIDADKCKRKMHGSDGK